MRSEKAHDNAAGEVCQHNHHGPTVKVIGSMVG
jgi:hypothetical protein